MAQALTLISAVFGGAIALAAIVLNDKFDHKRQEKQLLRQKLERLLLLIYSLKSSASKTGSQAISSSSSISKLMDFDSAIEDFDSDLAIEEEIEVISNLYFPDLEPYVNRVLSAFINHRLVTVDFKSKMLENKTNPKYMSCPDMIKASYDQLISDLDELSHKLTSEIKELVKEARSLSRRVCLLRSGPLCSDS